MWFEWALVAYLSYAQTFDRPLPSINEIKREKEIEMNFTNGNGLDLIYYDVDFFEDHSEKMNYRMNDENTATE